MYMSKIGLGMLRTQNSSQRVVGQGHCPAYFHMIWIFVSEFSGIGEWFKPEKAAHSSLLKAMVSWILLKVISYFWNNSVSLLFSHIEPRQMRTDSIWGWSLVMYWKWCWRGKTTKWRGFWCAWANRLVSPKAHANTQKPIRAGTGGITSQQINSPSSTTCFLTAFDAHRVLTPFWAWRNRLVLPNAHAYAKSQLTHAHARASRILQAKSKVSKSIQTQNRGKNVVIPVGYYS
jgi:hypothetical protein